MLTCGLLRTNFSFEPAVSLGLRTEPSARIELATPSLPRKCTATVLRGRTVFASGRRDSNPRQPAWKAGALPAELRQHGLRSIPSAWAFDLSPCLFGLPLGSIPRSPWISSAGATSRPLPRASIYLPVSQVLA